jgi:tetratricopeptide (TPR) repeat protein
LLLADAQLRTEAGDLNGADAALDRLEGERPPGEHFASVADGLRTFRAFHQRGVVRLRQGRHAEAAEQFRRVLSERPDQVHSWVGLGEAALGRQDWGGVEEAARGLEGRPGGTAEAAVLRGRSCLERKDFAAARAVLGGAVAASPRALWPRVFLSHALLQEGRDLDAAEGVLRGVLELAPDFAQARDNLALLLKAKAGRPADAVWAENVPLAQLYQAACQATSDVNEHLPTLYELARECRHVTEFGTRTGVSTTALLYAQPERLVCYDRVRFPEVDRLARAAGRTEFVFRERDVLWAEIEETDLLFIDTLHTYGQLSEELRLHAGKVRKYIVLHDTTTFGERGEGEGQAGLWPAVEEFLARGTFRLRRRFTHNNGLTVLEAVADAGG